ncbi:MAG: ACP S-malonyltransferase [Candidatus Cryptobacteroides sp.]|nr:ACP S-malonyltransferase [Candidatus Cryptobacteroides sp.]
MKKAYMFPGQGSQFPGMGKDLYDNIPLAREMFEKADEILGFRITDVMFGDDAEALKATHVTQPAVFLHSVILAACYRDMDPEKLAAKGLAPYGPDMVAGHSLGEFSALTVAGAMKFEDALRLVSIRARAMQKCCDNVPGGMAAIIALSDEQVEDICSRIGGVVAANYNSRGQVVISGKKEAIEKACAAAKEAGAKRALPLQVSGAFHSPLMEPAREELAEAIGKTSFMAPECPVYQNVTARPETDPEKIKDNLLRQLTSPVRWSQSVLNMVADGAGSFLEIGPGAVLQGLVKRTAGADVEIMGISSL